jgi:hypothetical protein
VCVSALVSFMYSPRADSFKKTGGGDVGKLAVCGELTEMLLSGISVRVDGLTLWFDGAD